MKKTSTKFYTLFVAGLFFLFCGTTLKAQCNTDFTYVVSGLTVNFTNTSTGFTAPQYTWTFGDANTSNQASPSHTYAAAGTYTVCLFGGDFQPFCVDSTCHVVTVTGSGINDLPRANGTISNYPNPFSGSTTIDYALNEEGKVEISVYDVLGNKVSMLENSSNKQAGSYKIPFDAADLRSGVYFLKLTLNGLSLTQKMTLVK